MYIMFKHLETWITAGITCWFLVYANLQAGCFINNDYIADEPELATPVNTTISSAIDYDTDRDILKFTGNPFSVYTITVTHSTGFDSEIRVFDPNGTTQLAYGSSANSPGTSTTKIGIGNVQQIVYVDVRAFSELGNGYYTVRITEQVDSDNDGYSDAQEQQMGTNPYNKNSLLKITNIVKTKIDTKISWPVVKGKTYTLMKAYDIDSPYFQKIFTVTATATETYTYTDTDGSVDECKAYYVNFVY